MVRALHSVTGLGRLELEWKTIIIIIIIIIIILTLQKA